MYETPAGAPALFPPLHPSIRRINNKFFGLHWLLLVDYWGAENNVQWKPTLHCWVSVVNLKSSPYMRGPFKLVTLSRDVCYSLPAIQGAL